MQWYSQNLKRVFGKRIIFFLKTQEKNSNLKRKISKSRRTPTLPSGVKKAYTAVSRWKVFGTAIEETARWFTWRSANMTFVLSNYFTAFFMVQNQDLTFIRLSSKSVALVLQCSKQFPETENNTFCRLRYRLKVSSKHFFACVILTDKW